jgi:hypothetical protein
MVKKTKRFDGGGLADDETRLKRYANLSRGEKQAIDLSLRDKLASAQSAADAGDSLWQRASDIGSKVLLATPVTMGSAPARRQLDALNAGAAAREDARQNALQEAQDAANYVGYDRKLYGSSTPGKLSDNFLPFKKGGKVKAPARTKASKRGDGIASKGHTKGKYL